MVCEIPLNGFSKFQLKSMICRKVIDTEFVKILLIVADLSKFNRWIVEFFEI